MIRAAFFVGIFVLSACGADGPPIRPSMTANVSLGSDGISTSTGITLERGPVTIGAAF